MSADISPRDLRAYAESVRLTPAELVDSLRDLLGARMVAYLGSVKETRAVHQWAEGERAPSPQAVRRLRTAYQTAAILRARDADAVVQAWFQGMNPLLDDAAPARLLREGDLDAAGPRVLAAARTFTYGEDGRG